MDPYRMRVALASLCLLENIGSSAPLGRLKRVLEGLEAGCEEFARAWGALVSSTLQEGSLADQLKREMVLDANPFARKSLALPFEKLDKTLVEAAGHDAGLLSSVLEEAAPGRLIEAASNRWPDMAAFFSSLPLFDAGGGLGMKGAKELYDFYRKNGYGFFAVSSAFLYRDKEAAPIACPDPVTLGDLKGYARQKKVILENTRLFLTGKEANNILLYGDKGTGKSSTVKAVFNEFKGDGLKLIEIGKKDMASFHHLCELLKVSPFHFILFLDDISFAREDDNFTALKALIEGGIAKKPENVVIYATSNRRHLIGEKFSDRQGDDIHVKDTIETITSLSDRFGIEIVFESPKKDEYLGIVEALALDAGVGLERENLHILAERFALQKGGRSPRAARQFIASLEAGRPALRKA